MLLENGRQVVIYGPLHHERTCQLLDAIHRDYDPSKTLILIDPDDPESLAFWKEQSLENLRVLEKVIDWGEDSELPVPRQKDGIVPTAYVCANFTCKAPTQDPNALAEQMRGVAIPVTLTETDFFGK